MTDETTEIPTVLIIDVEPDDPAPRRAHREPWTGFEAWFERAKRLRGAYEAATGREVHFNWYLRMDPQITYLCGDPAWVADANGSQLAELRAAGDQLGVHPHAWRWEEPPGRWLHDYGNGDWLEECVATSFDAYRGAFGEECLAVRIGSRYLSPRLIRQFHDLGVRVDVTVEPGARAMATLDPAHAFAGTLPSMEYVPQRPYRPSADDPLKADQAPGQPVDQGLWMLPATAFDPAPFLSVGRRLARRVKYVGRPLHRPTELWAKVEPTAFWNVAEDALLRRRQPYICLVVRSDTLVRPYLEPWVSGKLDALASRPMARRLAFMTATEAVDALTASPTP